MVCIYVCFRAQSDSSVLEFKTDTQAPCEATNKEGFYSRVESYSISFYTVAYNIMHQKLLICSILSVMKTRAESLVSCLSEIFLSIALFEMGRQTSHTLSPNVCQIWLDQRWLWYAQVFQLPCFPMCITSISFRLQKMWAANKGKDSVVLHYSKCQKYIFIFHFVILDESRIAEITKQLQTQHEKFCPWPDFPCPGRSKNILLLIYILYIFTLNYKNVMFNLNICIISERFWLIPACEPSILLTAFLERFRSTCLLGQQLPALKSEHLKSMVRQ